MDVPNGAEKLNAGTSYFPTNIPGPNDAFNY
jgi:hypothetical protein